MAQTFTAYFSGVVFGAGKAMGAMLNTSASEVIKVRRIGILNAQTAAVTGVVCQMELRLYPATMTYTGSTAVTPTEHDSANTAAASLTVGHSGTPGGSTPAVLRRIWWSSDEASVSGASIDEMEANVPLNIIWDAGYGDTNVQPMTLHQDEGWVLWNTVGAVGQLDTWAEYTKE